MFLTTKSNTILLLDIGMQHIWTMTYQGVLYTVALEIGYYKNNSPCTQINYLSPDFGGTIRGIYTV